MKEKVINILKLFLCFFLFYFGSDIVGIVLSIFNIDISNLGNLGRTVANLILSSCLLIIIFLIYWKDIFNDFRIFKKNFKNRIMFTLKLFVIFMLIKIFASYISVIIANLFNIQELTSDNQNTINDLLGQFPILMSISAVFLAPLYEEFLFRLGFKKFLNNKIAFVLISGMLFGLIHIFPTDLNLFVAINQSIVYVTMGICLAYYYQKYNNIFYSVLIHFYNNLISIIFILLSFLFNLL